ncbi:MAG: zinc ribbon domain-containing protein [Oligoflexia bacterium]|nr:zinc ribbon domain-containing protein [Oligoflexia bacterium]MBF0367347.1 zinc ribbon domain-containing protein [Oligoflexia bacterium]
MPVYDFLCSKCNHQFEVSLKLAELTDHAHQEKICPECSSKEVQRLLTFRGGVISKEKRSDVRCEGAEMGACSGCAGAGACSFGDHAY